MKRVFALILPAVAGAAWLQADTLPKVDAQRFSYGLANPFSVREVITLGQEEMAARLREVKSLGVNIVAQSFPSSARPAEWKRFFDAAHQTGLKAFARIPVKGYGSDSGKRKTLDPDDPVWNGKDFDLGPSGEFARVMKDHPALAGLLATDEPLENHTYNMERLAILYRQFKAIAPQAPVAVGWSWEIGRVESGEPIQDLDSRTREDVTYRRGVADINLISGLVFRQRAGRRAFLKDRLLRYQPLSRAAIEREAPDSLIWSSAQAFGGGSYYMPSAQEMRQLAEMMFAMPGRLDGIFWQLNKSHSGLHLFHPQCAEQKRMVRAIAAELGLLAQ